MTQLIDTHYHLDFIKDKHTRYLVLEQLAAENIEVVAQTILPSEFVQLNEQFEWPTNTPKRLSLGFHPWYMTNIEIELSVFEQNLSKTIYIGEIGLDFVPKRLEQVDMQTQIEIFSQIISWLCNYPSPFVVSIHAVRAEKIVVDILEQFEVSNFGVTPIIHRFNGTSDDLVRLMKLGGYISVHSTMVTSKKGRAYIKQAPLERLLLETDLPDARCDYVVEVKDQLQCVISAIEEIKCCDIEPTLYSTQEKLYGL